MLSLENSFGFTLKEDALLSGNTLFFMTSAKRAEDEALS